MAKSLQRIKARKLRREGKSIKSIARRLRVSSSTVSLWCKDIKLSPDQIRELERHSRDPLYGKRLENALKQQRKRIEKTLKLKEAGTREIGNLTKRELFLAGAALYWAEGFKKDSQAGLASLDPGAIKFFLRWLRDCFGYTTDNLSLRVTVNISHKNRIDEIQNHWSQIIGVPIKNFQKPFYQNVIWKKTYENPNEYFGVLRVKVKKSTDFLRKINGYIEGLKLNAT